MFHLGSIDLQTLIFLVEPIEEPGNWCNGFEMIESHKSGGLETEFSKKNTSLNIWPEVLHFCCIGFLKRRGAFFVCEFTGSH